MQLHLTFLWKVNITCYTINSDLFLAIPFKTNELLTRHWVMVSCLQRFLFLYFAKHSWILGFVIKKKVTFWVWFSWNQQTLKAAGKTREKFSYLFFITLYDFDRTWTRFLHKLKVNRALYSHKKLLAETFSISISINVHKYPQAMSYNMGTYLWCSYTLRWVPNLCPLVDELQSMLISSIHFIWKETQKCKATEPGNKLGALRMGPGNRVEDSWFLMWVQTEIAGGSSICLVALPAEQLSLRGWISQSLCNAFCKLMSVLLYFPLLLLQYLWFITHLIA